MKRATLAGHPLHPQLVSGPIGLLPFSLAMDLAYHATGRESYAQAAYYAMVGGAATGLAAGATGAADYLTIPDRTAAKQVANTHALLNLAVLGIYGASLAMRRKERRPSLAATLLSAVGAVGLMVSQWYGGQLVYHHGMRVREREEARARLPADQVMERGFRRIQRMMPQRGPATKLGAAIAAA
ncbi:MAG TPA: DUF2231 domain-containing protein [Phycisphaeraceae bacterium]